MEKAKTLISNETPEKFIKKWFFKKGENPGDAATIASQLKLNELELYTQTERFIFELLQNADDMPIDGKPVNVQLEILEDYFLFLHDGKFFTREDVESICDAAKSTKTKDQSKTGYKGIGFKSVFTDSSKVYIKSKDYSFKFDKLSPIYNDFYKLYSGYIDSKTEESKQEFISEYEGKEEEYTRIDRIPWQIKPIWVSQDKIPDRLIQSNFGKGQNVSIALEIGAEIFHDKNYSGKVENLLKEPRFLIFLRNIKSISFQDKEKKIELSAYRKDSFFNISFNNTQIAQYVKFDFEVEITNESFKEAGLDLTKKELEKGKYEFIDGVGKKIENIPEKLSILDKTTISFAAKVGEKGIENLPKKDSILFNYLPTSDKRFEFPFLVNGDFVSKTDREFILHENLWNQYLFYQIGFFHVIWVEKLLDSKDYDTSYLNVLFPKEMNTVDENFKAIHSTFNNGFIKGINEIKFIINDKKEKSLAKDIILDESGISQVLGNEVFYKIFGKEKQLPLKGLDSKILGRKVLGIKKITIQNILEKIKFFDSKQILEQHIHSVSEESYLKFLDWLDKVCQVEKPARIKTARIKAIVNNLKFIRIKQNNQLIHKSWTELKRSDNLLMLDNRLTPLKEILSKLGFSLSTFSISFYTNIFNQLDKRETYLNNELSVFKIIRSRCPDNKLEIYQKINLFSFFKKLGQVGDEKITQKLYLFKDTNGKTKPLFQLVENKPSINEFWITPFKINLEEGLALSRIGKYACDETNIYSRIIDNENTIEKIKEKVNSTNLSIFYDSITKYYNSDISKEKTSLNNQSIIYVDDEARFKKINELYCSETLVKNISNYSGIKTCIEELTGHILPHRDALNFIDKHQFTCRIIIISYGIKYDTDLDTEDANAFLSYLVNVDTKENIFSKGYFTNTPTGVKFESNLNILQYYSTDIEFNNFIGNHKFPTLKRLPHQLSQVSRLHEIGLKSSNQILQYLIREFSFNPSLINFIQDNNTKILWLKKLQRLDLTLNQEYTSTSFEHGIIEFALSLQSSNPTIFERFRNKIWVDQKSISKVAIYDEVKVKRNEKIYKFSLAKLLPEYDGRSNLISALIEKFIGFRKKEDLVKKLFRLTSKFNSEIIHEIKSKGKLTNEEQFIFWGLSNRLNFNGVKIEDITILSVLDYCYKKFDKSFPPLIDFSKNLSLFPYQCIYPNRLASSNEKLPEWVLEWIQGEEKDDKISFLKELGLNTQESHLGKLRTFFLNPTSELPELEILQLKKENQLFLGKTLEWITENSIALSEINLKGIFEILKNVKPSSEIYFPIIYKKTEEEVIYKLIMNSKEEFKYFDYNTIPEPYKKLIYTSLSQKENHFFIDSKIPKNWKSYLNSIEVTPIPSPNISKLEMAKLLASEPYSNWKFSAKYPIYLIEGQIPRIKKFNEIILEEYLDGDLEFINKKCYVNSSKINDLPRLLSPDLSSDEEKNSLLKVYLEFNKLNSMDLSEKLTLITNEKNKALEKIKRLEAQVESLTKVYEAPIDRVNITTIDTTYTGELRGKSERTLFSYLKKEFEGKGTVEWMNEEGESGKSYDFIVKNLDGEIIRIIDCKGTPKMKPTFYMSSNEWNYYLDNKEKYFIYRVFNVSNYPLISDDDIKELHLFNSILDKKVVPYLNKKEHLNALTVYLTIK